MPKVELHLHLEGALPIEALWRLVESSERPSEIASARQLREKFAYRDFAHFIELWKWKNQFLDTYESFEYIAEAVAADLARQHIVYAEVYFSPTDFAPHGLEPDELAMAIRRGLDRATGTSVALIVDLVRHGATERADATFDRVRDVAEDADVIGITIGGLEAEFPPEPFGPVYRRAREAGFRLTAHAGEAAGPASVWGAIEALGVERIGHGIRIIEDERLLAHVIETQIPLEVCPTSNLRTGVVSSWDDHPVEKLIRAGTLVTLNSDDPAMFDCTLAGEYDEVSRRFGFDDATIRQLSLNAVDASWADPPLRRRLYGLISDWWAKP